MGAESTVIDGKYKTIRLLGQGGMGAVYEAEHLGTGRRVALKVIVSEALANETDVVRRFQREARASGSIDSQHVVQVLDTGVDPATRSPYMVMELLSGEDVSDLCKRLGALHPELVLRIVAQACLGLQRAHEKGIIHRDIKSANVYLSRRDGGERVLKLLDFGIAKVRSDQLSASDNHGLTRTGAMLGSPLYMSPEQARGAKTIDARSDLFSLGVMMYEALAGTTPNGHCDTLGELILAICSQQTEPLQNRAPWVLPQVAGIVHKALAQDPAHRFESAAAMHAAIAALLPQGTTIHETMLVGVSPELRAYIAPRFEPVPTGPVASSQSHLAASVVQPSSRAGSVVNSTTAGVGRTAPGSDDITLPKHPSPARWLVPLAGLVLLGGLGAAGFAFKAWKSKVAAAPAAAASSAVSVISSAVIDPAATIGVAVPAAATRTVQVIIAAPADAKVDVDGRPVDVKEGKVLVRGAIGSVHPVRISLGGRESRADVAIAETGPIPERVELLTTKHVAGSTRPAAPASVAAAPSAAQPASQPAPQPKQPAPKQPAGAPTIAPNF